MKSLQKETDPWFVEKCVKWFRGGAACDPTGKLDPISEELPVCVVRVWSVDGEVFRLIVPWRGSGNAFGHSDDGGSSSSAGLSGSQ